MVNFMEYVIYTALACSIAAFVLSVIAGARVGKFQRATADTDWETLANLTGDIAALKRTAQTLNNRLNGMEGGSSARSNHSADDRASERRTNTSRRINGFSRRFRNRA